MPRSLARPLIGAFGLIMLVGARAAAQRLDAAPFWTRDVEPGVMVLVHVHGERLGGPVRQLRADSLRLGPAPGYAETDTAVAVADVDSLWIMKSHAMRGVIVGGAVGAAGAYALAAQEINFCPGAHSGCPGNRFGASLIGFAAGGLVGWLIGSGTSHWVRRFP